MTNSGLEHGVSAIVCCYNSAAVIASAVRALAEQKVAADCGYELILVDNGCCDDTVAVARAAWGNSAHPLHVIQESRPGLIHARKAGIFKARYQFILFIDDDNIVEPGWVERLPGLFHDRPEVGAIGGFIAAEFTGGGEKPEWFDKYSGMFACTPAHENPQVSAFKPTLYGAGMSFRTEVLRSLFSSPLPFFLAGRTADAVKRGDDSEICLRAGLSGWKCWYENTLKLRHLVPASRANWDYMLQARRGGGCAEIVLKIYKDLLEGAVPLDYGGLAEHIALLWLQYWRKRKNRRDMAALMAVGSEAAIRFHYLQGLSECFWEMGEQEYGSVRGKIVDFFAPNKHG